MPLPGNQHAPIWSAMPGVAGIEAEHVNNERLGPFQPKGGRMIETIIVVVVVVVISTWIYHQGKVTGSRKAFGAGFRRGRRRR